jgi:hypothetical protein
MEATEVPVGNIGARGCQRRRLGGWVWTVIAIITLVSFGEAHVSRGWVLVLAIPIALAALGFLQAREQTCVFHAAVGTRENDDGVVKLDPRAAPDVKRRAWRVAALSIAIAVLVTAIVYFA